MVSRLPVARYLIFIFTLLIVSNAIADSPLRVSPTSVAIQVGALAKITVTGYSGTVTVTSSNTSVATVSYASGVATVKGVKVGKTSIKIKGRKKRKQLLLT